MNAASSKCLAKRYPTSVPVIQDVLAIWRDLIRTKALHMQIVFTLTGGSDIPCGLNAKRHLHADAEGEFDAKRRETEFPWPKPSL
jgi:hypothetical protein